MAASLCGVSGTEARLECSAGAGAGKEEEGRLELSDGLGQGISVRI
jgi:hypothetical protein